MPLEDPVCTNYKSNSQIHTKLATAESSFLLSEQVKVQVVLGLCWFKQKF